MPKNAMSVIGIAVAIVILVIAFRIFEGAGGSVKVAGVEASVNSESEVEKDDSNEDNKKKILKEFERSFSFKNHACDTNADVSVQKCVDAGYILTGMVGEAIFTSKDRCGSNLVSFEKVNETCGKINVHLQGCGFDSASTCVSHAFINGNLTLQGYKFE